MSDSRPRRAPGTARPAATRARLRDALTAYIFLSPSMLIIAVFGVFPLFFTLYVSLFKWRLSKGSFFGLGNYAILFGRSPAALLAVVAAIAAIAAGAWLAWSRAGGRGGARLIAGILLLAVGAAGLAVSLPYLASGGDIEVFDSLRVTIWYCILTVPVQLVLGVLLAVLLNRRMRGRQAFRVISLVPYIAPTVATAAIFELLFSLRPDSFANQVLGLLGSPALQWLQEPRGIVTLLFGARAEPGGVIARYWGGWAQGPSLALVSIIVYSWWVFVGYYALIYLNGLSSIPRQLYEAAEVDGAGRARSFFSITLPLLSPTTYFLSLLGVIGTFKAFTHLFVLRSPAASGTVDAVSLSVFLTAFRKGNLGYASAVSVLLFVIVLALALLQQRVTERSVTYGD